MRLRGDPLWVFDLDNTLHNASPHIFPHINRAMTAYICRHLALDEDAANQLRQAYWKRYGATLIGLIRHHGTDPQHFLWHTHQFPELSRMLVWERPLRHVLRRLPGRKVVFSNAPRHYAEAVLELIGADRDFDAVYTIESVGFRPKPDPAGFRQVLSRESTLPARAIMVEDSLENLYAAKRIGMKTVWISPSLRRPPAVNLKISRLSQLPRRLPRLLPTL